MTTTLTPQGLSSLIRRHLIGGAPIHDVAKNTISVTIGLGRTITCAIDATKATSGSLDDLELLIRTIDEMSASRFITIDHLRTLAGLGIDAATLIAENIATGGYGDPEDKDILTAPGVRLMAYEQKLFPHLPNYRRKGAIEALLDGMEATYGGAS